MKNEYSKFLKHLGINKNFMLSDMQSRLPEWEKPQTLKRCKEFEVCESVKHNGCRGCNVWNYLYDIKALQKWCKEHDKDFMLFSMKMHKMLQALAEENEKAKNKSVEEWSAKVGDVVKIK